MGFEVIHGSKKSWGRTRTSELARCESVKTLCSSRAFLQSIILALTAPVKIFLHQCATESVRARKTQISYVLLDVARHRLTQNFLEIPLYQSSVGQTDTFKTRISRPY